MRGADWRKEPSTLVRPSLRGVNEAVLIQDAMSHGFRMVAFRLRRIIEVPEGIEDGTFDTRVGRKFTDADKRLGGFIVNAFA